MDLVKKVEAILFYKSEPISTGELAKICSASTEEVAQALQELKLLYNDRGITLMQEGERFMFATAPEVSDFIKKIIQEEYTKDLGKAGLETLAIVLYRGPVTKAQIDNIRGVNSTFILRNLLVRGLVERVPNERDSRSFLYRASFDLLRHLGVSSVKELPEYEVVGQTVKALAQEGEKTEESDG